MVSLSIPAVSQADARSKTIKHPFQGFHSSRQTTSKHHIFKHFQAFYPWASIQGFFTINPRCFCCSPELPDFPDASCLIVQVAECLTMHCPKCHCPLDPDPDGCVAMSCLACNEGPSREWCPKMGDARGVTVKPRIVLIDAN